MIQFHKVDVQHIVCCVYKIDAYVMNTGYLPTYITREALKLQVEQPIKVSLSGEGIAFVQGKQEQDIGQLEGYSAIVAQNVSVNGLSTEYDLPCEKRVSWIITAKEGTTLTITCHSDKVGTYKKEICV